VQLVGDRGRDARLLRTATALIAMLSATQKKKRGASRAS
jgi:Asp-tRNA(Asn)/Glu-tRNA(Gln) amidotransferase A subunit family amidase